MSAGKRKKLIEFIKTHDIGYNYSNVDFKFYSNEDLRLLKHKLEQRIRPTH